MNLNMIFTEEQQTTPSRPSLCQQQPTLSPDPVARRSSKANRATDRNACNGAKSNERMGGRRLLRGSKTALAFEIDN